MHGYEKFREFLLDEGYRISDEQDSFYVFRREGVNYFVFKNESPFVQVTLVLGTGDNSRSKLLEVCNQMNDDRMLVKFVVRDDNVLCNAEFAIDEVSHEFLDEVLVFLDHVSDQFFDKLNE